MAIKIQGIEGLSQSQIDFELQRGAKFVLFQYCVSVIVLTFKRSSDIYFIRSGESAVGKGLPFTLVSLVAGWWGIPWGPIYTVQSIYNNFQGGKDVTQQVCNSMRARRRTRVQLRPAPGSLLAVLAQSIAPGSRSPRLPVKWWAAHTGGERTWACANRKASTTTRSD